MRLAAALLRRGLPLPAALRLDSTATPNKNIQTEEYNMTTINLRELYPWYTEDTFIEVSDEVAAFLEEDKRLQINYAQYIRDNRAFYSLDAGDGIEAEALNLPEQPDEALERMEHGGRFATIPILKRTGEYVGTISEGDLLWAIKNNYMMNMKDAEGRPVMEVARKKDYLPVTVTTSPKELISMAVEQNFVPVVDDREAFIGIVTRQKIMEYCMEQYFQKAEQAIS